MTDGRWWSYIRSSRRLGRHKNCTRITNLVQLNVCVHRNKFQIVHLPPIKSSLLTLLISHTEEPMAPYFYCIRMKASTRRYICTDPIKGCAVVVTGQTWIHENHYDMLLDDSQPRKMYCVNRGIGARCANNQRVNTIKFLADIDWKEVTNRYTEEGCEI